MKRADFYGMMLLGAVVSTMFGVWQHSPIAGVWMGLLCLFLINLRAEHPFSEPWK